MRLMNRHTANIDDVKPGEVSDFDTDNRGVADLIKAEKLMPEGAVMASRARALIEGPSLQELAALRADVNQKDLTIRQLLASNGQSAEEMKRMEAKFQLLSAQVGNVDESAIRADAVKSIRAQFDAAWAERETRFDATTSELNATISSLRTDLAAKTTAVADLTARVSSLETDIAAATTPTPASDASSASQTTTIDSDPKKTRNPRNG